MGYRVLGVLSWGSRVTPKFSAPPSGKTTLDPKNYRGSRTCSTSSITVPSLVGLGFQVRTGRTKMLSFCLVCLSVCLFAMLLNVRVCDFVRPISPWIRWSTEMISMPLIGGIWVCIRVQLRRSRKMSRPCKVSVSSRGKNQTSESRSRLGPKTECLVLVYIRGA